jgi:hypothetical protein
MSSKISRRDVQRVHEQLDALLDHEGGIRGVSLPARRCRASSWNRGGRRVVGRQTATTGEEES